MDDILIAFLAIIFLSFFFNTLLFKESLLLKIVNIYLFVFIHKQYSYIYV